MLRHSAVRQFFQPSILCEHSTRTSRRRRSPENDYNHIVMQFKCFSVSSTRYSEVSNFVSNDNILVASSSHEEHLRHLVILFKRLKSYGVMINPGMCVFVKSTGTRPLPEKVNRIYLNILDPHRME